MLRKLTSISIFFPFYSDAGTVERQIVNAYNFGNQVANEVEVIALIGGNSKDDTALKRYDTQKRYPDLKIVDKTDNCEGYAVIKYGFKQLASSSQGTYRVAYVRMLTSFAI